MWIQIPIDNFFSRFIEVGKDGPFNPVHFKKCTSVLVDPHNSRIRCSGIFSCLTQSTGEYKLLR